MNKIRLHLGHIGLLDSAPLLIAQDRGFFAEQGLDVSLTCELGLATICGKLADQRMDGACLPAPLPVLLTLGTGVPRVGMRGAGVCAWQGLGVVLAGARGAGRGGAGSGERIGIVTPGTPSRLLLHKLSQSSRPPLSSDAALVPMAASQLIEFLREGMLDGFCAMDPLPALARLLAGADSVADSAALWPGHPGSVVALRSERVEAWPELAPAVARALAKARDYCGEPSHREEVGRLVLAQPPYADLDAAARDALLAHIVAATPGWLSLRFDAPPSERAGLSAAAESFLEHACRGAAGLAARNVDFKAAISRVFPKLAATASTGVSVGHQKVNT